MLAAKLKHAVAAAAPLYVDDVFSTWLYAGTGAAQSIVNGIDLAGYGGMVWGKNRASGYAPVMFDTARGARNTVWTSLGNSAYQAPAGAYDLTAFDPNGFSLGASYGADINSSSANYASWTFRKAAKFFDIVTYTGTGSAQSIGHNLGAAPGMIQIKRLDTTGDWRVYHRSIGATKYLVLNSTAAEATSSAVFNNTSPTSTSFTVGTDATVNANGGTYVAYIYGHDTTSDGIIQCGSVSTSSAAPTAVTLGWEPQYIIYRSALSASDWFVVDCSRKWTASFSESILRANSSAAEADGGNSRPTATGFVMDPGATSTYIYMAIRRPNKPVTDATKVFKPVTRTGTDADAVISGVGFAPDLIYSKIGNFLLSGHFFARLAGLECIASASSAAAIGSNSGITAYGVDGISVSNDGTVSSINVGSRPYSTHFFRRARGFLDIVCYTGNGGTGVQIPHGLGVTPELPVFKKRSAADSWYVPLPMLGTNKYMALDSYSYAPTYPVLNELTASYFVSNYMNESGVTYVAYLFASLPGVSKVGSYTGTGTTKQIDCGFAAGARFVMIKRSDLNGDWYYWDTARGIVSGNDPYLLMNSTAAEVTGTDYIDPYAPGFEISSTAPAALNASGGTYIFLAIA